MGQERRASRGERTAYWPQKYRRVERAHEGEHGSTENKVRGRMLGGCGAVSSPLRTILAEKRTFGS